MLGEIFAALSAVKEIIQTTKSIIDFVNASKTEAWFQSWQDSMILLRNAKTSKERQDAAKKIADALADL